MPTKPACIFGKDPFGISENIWRDMPIFAVSPLNSGVTEANLT